MVIQLAPLKLISKHDLTFRSDCTRVFSHEHLFRKKHLFRKRKRIISKKVRIFWDQKQARESRIITVTLSLKLIGYMCLKCHRTFKSILLQPIKSQRKQYSFNLKIMRTISLCSENTQSRTQASTQATEGKFEGTCYWKSSIVPSNLQ